MATASRLPQRKTALASRSVNDTGHNAGQIHSALAEIGYHSSTVQDLERILQGPVGDGIQVLTMLLVGRSKVAHIRSELQRIKELPQNQKRVVFSSATVVEKHANAFSKLSRTRKELALRQQELATLQSTAPSGTNPRGVERALGADRTTTFLLRVLLTKELSRVSRIGHVHQILDGILENTRKPGVDVEPKTSTLPAVLAEIHNHLPSVPHNGKKPLDPSIIKGATSSSLTLKKLHLRLQEAAFKLTTLGDEAASDCSNHDDLLDVLTLLRIRYNTLRRTLPPRTSTPVLSDLLNASLAKSLGCSPSDPEVSYFKKNLVASCETRIRDQLNEDTWAMFPETLSPSVRDLQDGFAAMDNECRKAQTLFSLYQYLLESATRMNEMLRERITAPLHDLRTVCQEKENVLLGHIDVQRRRIAQGLVESKCHDDDIHGALGLPPETGALDTLKNITDMVSQTAGLRQVPSGPRKMEIPVMDASVLNDFLRGQHEGQRNALLLLRRKNEKMVMRHVLEADIKRFVDERDAIVAGKLGQRGAGRAR